MKKYQAEGQLSHHSPPQDVNASSSNTEEALKSYDSGIAYLLSELHEYHDDGTGNPDRDHKFRAFENTFHDIFRTRKLRGIEPAHEQLQQLLDIIFQERELDFLERLISSVGINLNEYNTARLQDWYAILLKKGGDVEEAKDLRRITGIAPSDALFNLYCAEVLPIRALNDEDVIQLFEATGRLPGQEIVNEAYACALERGIIKSPEEYGEELGVEIPQIFPERVKKEFSKHVRNGDPFGARALAAITNMECVYNQEDVTIGYTFIVDEIESLKDRQKMLNKLKGMQNISDILPGETIAQKVYDKFEKMTDIGPKRVRIFGELYEFFQVHPKFDISNINKVYLNLITNSNTDSFNLSEETKNDIELWHQITGEPLPITEINDYYNETLENETFDDDLSLERLKGIKMDTELTPNFSPEQIQNATTKIFTNNPPDSFLFPRLILELRELTNSTIPLTPEEIQICYRALIKRLNSAGQISIEKTLNSFQEIAKATGQERAVLSDDDKNSWLRALTKAFLRSSPANQETYKLLVKSSLNELDIKLDKKIVHGLYILMAENHGWETITALQELSGIPADYAELALAGFAKHDAFMVDKACELAGKNFIEWSRAGKAVDTVVFFKIQKIPSSDLRFRAWKTVLGGKDLNLITEENTTREKNYQNIPAHLYGVLIASQFGQPGTLAAVDRAYEKLLSKKTPGRSDVLERLEYSIIQSSYLFPAFVGLDSKKFFNDFARLLEPEKDPQVIAQAFDALAIGMNMIMALEEAQRAQGERKEKKHKDQHFEQLFFADIEKTPDIHSFIETARALTTEWTRSVLQMEELTHESLARIQTEWGEIRPLLILAGKYGNEYPEGLPLFQEALKAVFDGKWKEFRYDMTNPIVADQFHGLNEAKRQAWITNLEAKSLGTVRIERREREMMGEDIYKIIDEANDSGHLIGQNTDEFGEDVPEAYSLELLVRNSLAGSEAGYTVTEMAQAREVIGIRIYEHTKLPIVLKHLGYESLDKIPLPDLSTRLQEEIAKLKTAGSDKRKSREDTALHQYRAALRWVQTYEKIGEDTVNKISSKIGISNLDTGRLSDEDIASLINMQQTYAIGYDIVRLAKLSPDELRLLTFKDENGNLGKSGSMLADIDKIITACKKKHLAFAQDLENIRVRLTDNTPTGTTQFSDLLIEESDHPKTLFEAGKYPIGSGSCQNYEGNVVDNKCLLAYVADGDKKIIVIRNEKKQIIARSIIKLVYIDDKEPAIFIEPTYTSVNKKDHNLDADIDRYIKEKAIHMGGIRVLRGQNAGKISVTVRASRNNYQYEDGGEGNVANAGLGVKEGEYKMNAVAV